MLSNLTNVFTNQLQIPGASVTLAVTDGTGGAFGGGILSAASHTIWLIFIGLMVVWVVLSMYAAYKLISGAGDPQEMEKGMSIVKNMWFGILAFFVFAMAISLIGTFMGFGNISEWSDNLAQCGPGMDFYFVEVENKIIKIEQNPAYGRGEYSVFCCQAPHHGYEGWYVAENTRLGIFPSICDLQNTVVIE